MYTQVTSNTPDRLFNHVQSIASGTIRSAMSFRESFTKCCDAIGRKQDACAGSVQFGLFKFVPMYIRLMHDACSGLGRL